MNDVPSFSEGIPFLAQLSIELPDTWPDPKTRRHRYLFMMYFLKLYDLSILLSMLGEFIWTVDRMMCK
jgi:hypothetical protein